MALLASGHTAYWTVRQIVLANFIENCDDLLLDGICHFHFMLRCLRDLITAAASSGLSRDHSAAQVSRRRRDEDDSPIIRRVGLVGQRCNCRNAVERYSCSNSLIWPSSRSGQPATCVPPASHRGSRTWTTMDCIIPITLTAMPSS